MSAVDPEVHKVSQLVEKGPLNDIVNVLKTRDPRTLKFTKLQGNILHVATAFNRQDLIDYLINQPYGIDMIREPDLNQETPLHMAAKKNPEAQLKMENKLKSVAAPNNQPDPNIQHRQTFGNMTQSQPINGQPMQQPLNPQLSTPPVTATQQPGGNQSTMPLKPAQSTLGFRDVYDDTVTQLYNKTSNPYYYSKSQVNVFLPSSADTINQQGRVYPQNAAVYDDSIPIPADQNPNNSFYFPPKGAALQSKPSSLAPPPQTVLPSNQPSGIPNQVPVPAPTQAPQPIPASPLLPIQSNVPSMASSQSPLQPTPSNQFNPPANMGASIPPSGMTVSNQSIGQNPSGQGYGNLFQQGVASQLATQIPLYQTYQQQQQQPATNIATNEPRSTANFLDAIARPGSLLFGTGNTQGNNPQSSNRIIDFFGPPDNRDLTPTLTGRSVRYNPAPQPSLLRPDEDQQMSIQYEPVYTTNEPFQARPSAYGTGDRVLSPSRPIHAPAHSQYDYVNRLGSYTTSTVHNNPGMRYDDYVPAPLPQNPNDYRVVHGIISTPPQARLSYSPQRSTQQFLDVSPLRNDYPSREYGEYGNYGLSYNQDVDVAKRPSLSPSRYPLDRYVTAPVRTPYDQTPALNDNRSYVRDQDKYFSADNRRTRDYSPVRQSLSRYYNQDDAPLAESKVMIQGAGRKDIVPPLDFRSLRQISPSHNGSRIDATGYNDYQPRYHSKYY